MRHEHSNHSRHAARRDHLTTDETSGHRGRSSHRGDDADTARPDAQHPHNGNDAVAGAGADAASFGEIGEIFNDATTRLIGGVDTSNKDVVLDDLSRVQTALQELIETHPDLFQGTAGIAAQNVVDQINLEIDAVNSVGTDPFAAKYISDVQRDLIDIVQGNDALSALASADGSSGFAGLPDTLAPAAPFQGNAEQTQFMRDFAAGAAELAERAVAAADSGAAPSSSEVQALIEDVVSFVEASSAFTFAQGGLYSARFDNEFADNGVNGTASRALIHGLETGNADEVRAAAEILAANAADVAGNMLGIGDDPVVINNGIPDTIDSFAVAGTVFDDATTQLVGGVYSGNHGAVIADLEATRAAVQEFIDDGQFDAGTSIRAQAIADHLGLEIAAVDAAADGTGAFGATAINDIHRDILDMVSSDPDLAAIASSDGVAGFTAPPETTGEDAPFHIDKAQAQFLRDFIADTKALGKDAKAVTQSGDGAELDALVARINVLAEKADQFVAAQGGEYTALFTDELSLGGTNGTASRALITGLESGDQDLVEAAQEELVLNALALKDEQTRGNNSDHDGGHHGWAHHDAMMPPDAALEQATFDADLFAR